MKYLLVSIGFLTLSGCETYQLAEKDTSPRTALLAQVNPEPAGNWSIEHAQISVEGNGANRSATNTILLNRSTGETWLLWPNTQPDGERAYSWLPIQRSDATPAPGNPPKPR